MSLSSLPLLSIARFFQSSDSLPSAISNKEEFTHWALLFKNERGSSLFHIRKKPDGGTQFECLYPFDITASQRVKDVTEVGNTDLTKAQLEDMCYEIAQKFIYHPIQHNCQNWVDLVLKELKLASPLPSNQTCGCLFIIKLTSSSESVLPSTIKK